MRRRAALLGLLLLLGGTLTALGGGCAASPPETGTPAGSSPSPQKEASPAASPSASAPSPAPSGPVTLTLWLPPAFDPAGESEAARLLRARLAAFEQRRPGVRVQVRVKAAEGEGGLMQTLTTAASAAPAALPDLALVSQDMLETGVLKGLFYPYDTLISLSDADWFDYPLQLGQSQGSLFGIPFAADALVMAYRTDKIETPPADWAALLETPAPLLFAAGDPQSAYPFALYLATGGSLHDEGGRPALQAGPLTEMLTRLDEAHRIGRFPAYLLQYRDSATVWQAYENEAAAMSIVWVSAYLQQPRADTALMLVPTPSGAPISVGTAWLWAMASPQHQDLSAELAAYLTLPEFLAQWTQAAGYLPPRDSALTLWRGEARRAALRNLIMAARPLPPASARAILSPLLFNAVEQILQEKSTPEEAAQAILEKLGGANP